METIEIKDFTESIEANKQFERSEAYSVSSLWSVHQPDHFGSEELTSRPNLHFRCQGNGENRSWQLKQ